MIFNNYSFLSNERSKSAPCFDIGHNEKPNFLANCTPKRTPNKLHPRNWFSQDQLVSSIPDDNEINNSVITLDDANCQIDKMIAKTRKEIDFAFESYKETGLSYYEGDKDSAEEAFDKCHTLYVQMMQIFLHSKNPNANKVLTSWKGRISILEADLKKLPAVTESIYT